MSSHANDNLRDHEYDGIREFDNPCPGWWWLVFFGTFVFSVVYFLYYSFNYNAATLADKHAAAVSANQELLFGAIGTLTADADTLLKYTSDDEWLPVGESVYQTNCVSCHAADGRGLVGPNLTDDYYKAVNSITDIAEVVTNGANNGAMPAWSTRLQTNEIVLVSAYVASLRGRNLDGLKIDGEKEIAPWSSAPAGTP